MNVMSAPENQAPESHTFADTGKIWTPTFILVAFVNLGTFMAFNMTNTGIPVFVDALGGSPFQVGLVTTLTTASALATRPFTGLMVDRFGRKGILVTGLLVTTASIALFALIPLIPVILVLRFIQGLGWGLSSTATSTICADELPPRRFAEGMGYFSLTTSLASAVAPALAVALLDYVGIDAMISVSLACIAIACVLAFLPALKTKPASETRPAPSEKTKLSLSTLFERRALFPSALIFLVNMAFAPITTFIVLHGQDRGIDGVFVYFIVFALANLVTRPVIGKIIDKTGFFWPAILSAASVILTMVFIASATDLSMFCVAGIFAGLGFGTAMGTFQTMAVMPVPPQRRGVATSTYLFGLNGGMTAGSLIAGLLVGPFGYGGMYFCMGLFPLIAGIMVVVTGPKHMKKFEIQ